MEKKTTVKREMRNNRTRMWIYFAVIAPIVFGLSVAFAYTTLSEGLRLFLVVIICAVLLVFFEFINFLVTKKREEKEKTLPKKPDPYADK